MTIETVQAVHIGAAADDGSGDALRDAFAILNSNDALLLQLVQGILDGVDPDRNSLKKVGDLMVASVSAAAAAAAQAAADAATATSASASIAAATRIADGILQAVAATGVFPASSMTMVPPAVGTGKTYWAVSADGFSLLLYINDGTATPAPVVGAAGEQASIALAPGQQALVASAVARGLTAAFGSYPVTPLIDLDASTLSDTRGAYWRNSAISSPAKPINIVQANATADFSVALLAGTQTSRYAMGPAGKMTAMRLQLPSGALAVLLDTVVLPTGTYTAAVKVKSKSGAGTQTLRFGSSSSAPDQAVSESAFTQVSVTITSNGTAATTICLYNRSGVAVDLLVDELQVVQGSTLPTFSASGVGHALPDLALPGRIPTSGGAADLRGGVKLRAPLGAYPDLTSITDWTMMALLSSTDATAVLGKAMAFQTGPSADGGVGVDSGSAWGSPADPGGYGQTNLPLANTGWHVLAVRRKATEAAFFIDGVKIYTVSASSAVTVASLFVGSDGNLPFKGLMSQAAYWARWLSDDEITAAMAVQKTRQGLLGLPAPKPVPNLWIAEGDSITAFGSSYFWQYFGAGPANIIGRDFAQGGAWLYPYGGANPTNNVTTRMAQTLPLIRAAAAAGMQPIVSLLIGANDIGQSSGSLTIEVLRTAWAQFRGAGAKVVACTILPSKTAPSFNPYRNSLNAQIRADAGIYYDALADFAADPIMGLDDAPAATGSPNTYYQDETHPLAPGHAILRGIIGPVVDGLKIAALGAPQGPAASQGANVAAPTSYALNGISSFVASHGLPFAPEAWIVTPSGQLIETDILHTPGATTAIFPAPFTGTLYLR